MTSGHGKPRVILGLDPGSQGAIAALSPGGDLLHSGVLPRHRRRNDLPGTWKILSAIDASSEVLTVGLELVVFGSKLVRHGGQLEGMIAALGWPCETIAPLAWQRGLPLARGQSKEAKRARKAQLAEIAKERWPSIDVHVQRLWGQADAALIGDYTRVRWLQRDPHALR